MIYTIGHKNPDTDCVVAPIALAYLLNKTDPANEYKAGVTAKPRDVTQYILDKFGIPAPEVITGDGKKLILVDHNEKTQQVDGADQAEILAIYDHHKLDFSYGDVINIRIEVIGSSCSLTYKMFKEHNVEIPKKIASIMLAAILDDTVILSSPTTTQQDKKIVDELATYTGLDYKTFGREIFLQKSNISGKSMRQIIQTDFKEMQFGGKLFAIGQAETVDISEYDSILDSLEKELQTIKLEKNYHTVIFFITDILKQGSLFIVTSDEPQLIETAFNIKLENNRVYIDGIMSRKKQVVPPLANTIK